jgi:NAD(P)-dependent dehydrogenase (short-subunit alcohol dehydrogenase family)
MRTWFITGSARGLGLEIARAALAAGDNVVATARRPALVEAALPEDGDRLLAVELDVTDQARAHGAVREALRRFGRIDVLVNIAGRGLLGAVEEVTDEEARALFDVNVFGTLAVTRAVLPVLREQRSGTVVIISSVGGFTQGPGWGVYGATKCAVEGFSESLSAELAPLGIDVLIVEPGIFRTDFLDSSSLRIADARIEDYAPTAGRTRSWVADHNHTQPGDPAKAAAAIVTVLDAPERPLRLQLGADCGTRVQAKLAKVAAELATWRDLAMSTGYDGAAQVVVPGYW